MPNDLIEKMPVHINDIEMADLPYVFYNALLIRLIGQISIHILPNCKHRASLLCGFCDGLLDDWIWYTFSNILRNYKCEW